MSGYFRAEKMKVSKADSDWIKQFNKYSHAKQLSQFSFVIRRRRFSFGSGVRLDHHQPTEEENIQQHSSRHQATLLVAYYHWTERQTDRQLT